MVDVAKARDEEPVDRRGFLRKLVGRSAGVAAGAAAASTLLSQPAGGAENATILIGSANDVNNTGGLTTTTLTNSQFKVVDGNGNLSLAATTAASSGTAIEATAPSGAALKATPTSTIPMPPLSGTWTRGSMRVDDPGGGLSDLWYCYADGAGGASGWYPLSLIPAFIPLTAPQRIYNSATSDGPMFSGQERTISSLTGGFVPPTAFAIAVNLAVFSTVGTLGFLAIFSADVPYPGHSNVNWFGNSQLLANGTVTATDINGEFTVRCGTNGSTQFVIDVIGFYTLTA